MIDKNERLIGKYTLKDLKERKSITLIIPLTQREIANLKYIKNNTEIRLRNEDSEIKDEIAYLKNVRITIGELTSLNKSLTVAITINNRELLKRSNIIDTTKRNINLVINTDDYDYSLKEYLKDETILEELFAKIRISNLSPLEKYIAVYNTVKNYKPYKNDELEKDEKRSRSLRYILDDNNDLIVCSGFARLLKDGLDRVRIPCKLITLSVEGNKENEYIGHARNIVKIDDSKYNIHGYYIADSTWDNKKDIDSYINSLSTFDRRKESSRLETLEDHDLLFDFHNPDEFIKKMQYYFKKHSSLPNITAAAEEELRKRSYKELYIKIINDLIIFDYEKYQELYNKYNDYLNIDLNKTTSNRIEISMTNFLYDYAKYVIPLSNKEISMDTILTAAIEVKKQINYMNDNEIKEWLEKTTVDNEKRFAERFPYTYNPNNPKEGYVEERNINHKR